MKTTLTNKLNAKVSEYGNNRFFQVAAQLIAADAQVEQVENAIRLGVRDAMAGNREADRFLTVAEYIEMAHPKTETRTTKKGTELIKVWYGSEAREYETKRIGDVCSYVKVKEVA